MENTTLGSASTAITPSKVIPLLEATRRIEELVSALAVRLDPITSHNTPGSQPEVPATTVTSRLQQVGDSLQYLLDNIEL